MNLAIAFYLVTLTAATLTSVSATELPLCSQLDLRSVNESTQCLSSTGVTFELIKRTKENKKEVWKDHATGLTWADREDTLVTFHRATELCNEDSSAELRGFLPQIFRLPTRSEVEASERNGFREVLSNVKLRHFWTSTPYPNHEEYAYLFSGSLGGWAAALKHHEEATSRCVFAE